MKIGDLVKWTFSEEAYHLAFSTPGAPEIKDDRRCGIIVDKNPKYFFVFWQNGDLMAQAVETIEVVNETR